MGDRVRDFLAVMETSETSLDPFLFEAVGMETGVVNFIISAAVLEGVDADIRTGLVYAEQ